MVPSAGPPTLYHASHAVTTLVLVTSLVAAARSVTSLLSAYYNLALAAAVPTLPGVALTILSQNVRYFKSEQAF